MRPIRRIALAALAVSALAAPVTGAEASGGGERSRAAVVPAPDASTVIGDVYANNLSLPIGESPYEGGPSLCLDVGRDERVLVPSGGTGPTECTVQRGRRVVFVLTSADCSTAEPPPFRAFTAVGQAWCAYRNVRDFGIRTLTFAVDGARPVDVHDWRFTAFSSQRRVVFPEDAVFQATPGPATFVSFGYVVEIRGLEVGTHTTRMQLDSVLSGPVVFDATVHVVR
jgi:hypothetical protein